MTRQLTLLAVLLTTALAPMSLFAQTSAPSSRRSGANGWRPPAGSENRYTEATTSERRPASTTAPSGAVASTTPIQRPGKTIRARVTEGQLNLPNDQGQVYREYDIRPYTARTTSTPRPEQWVVDWILRETGYESWHSEPLALLTASRDSLRVYHTPEMHQVVADIVDRFVNSQAEVHGFGLRIVTISSPNWRARALPLMNAIPVQSPGVQGWLLAKEDAALLLSEMRRRSDFREHNSPHLLVNNGQSTVISTMRPRTYIKGVVATQAVWPGYQPEMGNLEEGFTLEFSPLMTLDGESVDAVLKLRLNQIEKMLPVKLDVPSAIAPNQRTQVEVPQITMVQLHERFRWPTDQVLLLSMGVVATPGPGKTNPLTDVLPLPSSPPRADALLFVESKGQLAPTTPSGAPVATASRSQETFHGRY